MARDYVQLFKQGLPRGPFWQRALSSLAHKLYTGMMREFERVDGRVEDLLLECDPRTATEMLPDWEEALGLPDPEADPPPSTLEERRLAAHVRWIEKGGTSRPYLTLILVALGYAEEDIMFRIPAAHGFVCGQSECGAQPVNSPQSVFYTELVMRSQTEALDGAAKREMRRHILAPYQLLTGHRAPTFAFPIMLWSDATIENGSETTFTNPVTGQEHDVADGELGTVWVEDANTEVAMYGEEA